MPRGMKNFLKFLAIIIIVSGIYFGGYLVGHRNLEFEKGYIPKIANTELSKPTEIDFSLFWDAWNIVKDKFVGQLNIQKMTYGAIAGMVESLGDPYSMFLDPSQAKNFAEDLKGSFDGIGADMTHKDGKLVIVAPLEGSPAEKAGLKSQDIVLKIDKADVAEMTFQDAIAKIRGKKGTEVTLTVLRQGWPDSKDFTIKRETITVKSVRYEMKGDICYIRISQFGDDTVDLAKKAADFVLEHNARSIVVDLRNNPGGYVDAVTDITSLFIDKGVVVIEEYKDGKRDELKTTLIPRLRDQKLAVLTNGGSASASEIFAGAIQDNGRGILIGEKTFGKGSVQNLEKLKDDSEVRITIAKWLTPKGRTIDKEGIKPDIEIKLTDDDAKAGRDPQLERAIEELKR